LREQHAFSRKELAEKAKVDESTIYRLEKGKTKKAMPKTTRRLAAALEVKPQVLMSGQFRLFII